MKRVIDILLSLIALTILSPFLIPVVVALRLTGEGEIFYPQKRIGKSLVTFNMYKFATMLKNSPNIGAGMLTEKNDPRVFPFGRFLRKSKINELPQLWNVLKGDISIVGPRPQVKKHFDYFTDEAKSLYAKVQPGVTGIDSIVFRDEESLLSRNKADNLDFYKKVITPLKCDLIKWYVAHASIWTDIKIIFATIGCILLPKSKFYKSWFKGLPDTEMKNTRN